MSNLKKVIRYPNTLETRRSKRRYADISRKYGLQEAVLILERIDEQLKIPEGVTSYIDLTEYKNFLVGLLPNKRKSTTFARRRRSPYSKPFKKILPKLLSKSPVDNSSMDFCVDDMESLLTPEVNLVETTLPIMVCNRNLSLPKKYFVIRNQLPAKLKSLKSDHLWIQDPTCRLKKIKVHVIDSNLSTHLRNNQTQSEYVSVPSKALISPKVSAPERMNCYNELTKSQSLSEILDAPMYKPQTIFYPSNSNDSLLSTLLSQRLARAVPKQPGVQEEDYDACSFGLDHDHQYLGGTSPIEVPKPVASPLTVVISAPSVVIPPPTEHQVVSPLSTPQLTFQGLTLEQLELRDARKRIFRLESELTDNRKQLAAARVLINRLRLSDLAKSAQIRALKIVEQAQMARLCNQVQGATSFDDFGQHFMADSLLTEVKLEPM